jgi:GT2 family glycosyltransferase
VDIVIASYRDAGFVRALVKSIRRTVPRGMARVIVADDASGPEHLAALRGIRGIDQIVQAPGNGGFAANVNRGLAASDPQRDVVVLNSDVEARRRWLSALQYAASREAGVAAVGARLLYPDGRIQFAGTARNLGAPEWFDHRYRGKPADWGPARVPGPALAVSGACMYITRAALQRLGPLDEGYPMAYEDVDWCLRAWREGMPVLYAPAAELIHHESVTRGMQVGGRERASQRRFWERWGEFFDAREVRTAEGRLRIAYVTEDTGVGGGHRDVFEHLNRLQQRGHEVALYSLGGQPDWFDLRVPVHSFEYYEELIAALAPLHAIKVATWWNTGVPVWRASAVHGIPVYFVQDIETSYYPDDESNRNAVLDSYRPEFRYMTISSWNRERLRELGLEAELMAPGIDLDIFRPLQGVQRREDMLLALGRSNPLKNLPLTLDAWRALQPRPELCLFGIEPELAAEPGMRHVHAPSDEQVNGLFNEATVFVQTSTHEGFALPPLEAMASGTPVVTSNVSSLPEVTGDAALLVDPLDPAAIADGICSVLTNERLRRELRQKGLARAHQFSWEQSIHRVHDIYAEVVPDPAAERQTSTPAA